MSTYRIIRECGRLGITLTARGDSLDIKGPKRAISDALRNKLRNAKPALMVVLAENQRLGFTFDRKHGAWLYI